LGAAGIDIAIVRPPPGVWAGCSVPRIASVRPRDTGQRGARRRHRADDGIRHVAGAEQPS
ncbi:MAG: hypothetical protein WAK76_25305, partial [Trebonia sp.]